MWLFRVIEAILATMFTSIYLHVREASLSHKLHGDFQKCLKISKKDMFGNCFNLGTARMPMHCKGQPENKEMLVETPSLFSNKYMFMFKLLISKKRKSNKKNNSSV